MSFRDTLRERNEKRGVSSDTILSQAKLRNSLPTTSTVKLIKAGPGRSATIAVMPGVIDLSVPPTIGEEPVGLSVIDGAGTVVRGPLAIIGSPSDIKVSGIFEMNDLLLIGPPPVPGAPPIPVFVPSIPYRGLSEMMRLPAMLAMFGGLS